MGLYICDTQVDDRQYRTGTQSRMGLYYMGLCMGLCILQCEEVTDGQYLTDALLHN